MLPSHQSSPTRDPRPVAALIRALRAVRFQGARHAVRMALYTRSASYAIKMIDSPVFWHASLWD
jgi:hypothetical protein